MINLKKDIMLIILKFNPQKHYLVSIIKLLSIYRILIKLTPNSISQKYQMNALVITKHLLSKISKIINYSILTTFLYIYFRNISTHKIYHSSNNMKNYSKYTFLMINCSINPILSIKIHKL